MGSTSTLQYITLRGGTELAKLLKLLGCSGSGNQAQPRHCDTQQKNVPNRRNIVSNMRVIATLTVKSLRNPGSQNLVVLQERFDSEPGLTCNLTPTKLRSATDA